MCHDVSVGVGVVVCARVLENFVRHHLGSPRRRVNVVVAPGGRSKWRFDESNVYSVRYCTDGGVLEHFAGEGNDVVSESL